MDPATSIFQLSEASLEVDRATLEFIAEPNAVRATVLISCIAALSVALGHCLEAHGITSLPPTF